MAKAKEALHTTVFFRSVAAFAQNQKERPNALSCPPTQSVNGPAVSPAASHSALHATDALPFMPHLLNHIRVSLLYSTVELLHFPHSCCSCVAFNGVGKRASGSGHLLRTGCLPLCITLAWKSTASRVDSVLAPVKEANTATWLIL